MTNSSTARVASDRPARYGKQLASHFSSKLETHWDAEDSRGRLIFSGELSGEVEMIAGDGVLLLQIETEQGNIEQLEKVVGSHLVRFGSRDQLEVTWKRPGGVEGTRQVVEEGDE